MDIQNEFTLTAPVESVWELLNDIERTARCVPGFELLEEGSDVHRGRMKVKVGAVTMSYDAKVRFAERDPAARRAVIVVQGRETRGDGGVSATTTSQMRGEGDSTVVSLETSVEISGRAAQFGRGLISDVSGRLIGQFGANLERELDSNTSDVQAAPEGGDPSPRPAEPVDLLSISWWPAGRRLIAAAAFAMVVLTVVRWLVRRGPAR